MKKECEESKFPNQGNFKGQVGSFTPQVISNLYTYSETYTCHEHLLTKSMFNKACLLARPLYSLELVLDFMVRNRIIFKHNYKKCISNFKLA
jgi:hypothetical protein